MRVDITRVPLPSEMDTAVFSVRVQWYLQTPDEQWCWKFYGAPPLFAPPFDAPDVPPLFTDADRQTHAVSGLVIDTNRTAGDVRLSERFIDQVRQAHRDLLAYWAQAQTFHAPARAAETLP